MWSGLRNGWAQGGSGMVDQVVLLGKRVLKITTRVRFGGMLSRTNFVIFANLRADVVIFPK